MLLSKASNNHSYTHSQTVGGVKRIELSTFRLQLTRSLYLDVASLANLVNPRCSATVNPPLLSHPVLKNSVLKDPWTHVMQ